MNYFSLFNLPEQFQLDAQALNKTYQTLSHLTHPDKFASASEAERLAAIQKNAMVNDAYDTLRRPLSRAEHMLMLRGVELKHEQRTMQDPAFLMQQMEWREQLEEIDSTQDPLDALEDLDTEIHGQIKTHLKQLETLLAKNDEEHNQQAAEEVRKLKFMYKLLDEIEAKEDALDND